MSTWRAGQVIATLILYPGVGHLPMEQIPQRSADDLKAWLAAHPAPAEP